MTEFENENDVSTSTSIYIQYDEEEASNGLAENLLKSESTQRNSSHYTTGNKFCSFIWGFLTGFICESLSIATFIQTHLVFGEKASFFVSTVEFLLAWCCAYQFYNNLFLQSSSIIEDHAVTNEIQKSNFFIDNDNDDGDDKDNSSSQQQVTVIDKLTHDDIGLDFGLYFGVGTCLGLTICTTCVSSFIMKFVN